jgi:hypothetical protein
MKHRQRGATFLGMVVILLILGTAIYAGIRLVPIYLDYMKIARSLEQVRDEHAAIQTNPSLMRRSLERRWDVEDATGLSWQDVEIKKVAEGYTMEANYAVEQQFLYNVYLLVKFDKLVTVKQQ